MGSCRRVASDIPEPAARRLLRLEPVGQGVLGGGGSRGGVRGRRVEVARHVLDERIDADGVEDPARDAVETRPTIYHQIAKSRRHPERLPTTVGS